MYLIALMNRLQSTFKFCFIGGLGLKKSRVEVDLSRPRIY